MDTRERTEIASFLRQHAETLDNQWAGASGSVLRAAYALEGGNERHVEQKKWEAYRRCEAL